MNIFFVEIKSFYPYLILEIVVNILTFKYGVTKA